MLLSVSFPNLVSPSIGLIVDVSEVDDAAVVFLLRDDCRSAGFDQSITYLPLLEPPNPLPCIRSKLEFNNVLVRFSNSYNA